MISRLTLFLSFSFQGAASHTYYYFHTSWVVRINDTSPEQNPHACAVWRFPVHGCCFSKWSTVLRQDSPLLHAQKVPAGPTLPQTSAADEGPPVHWHPTAVSSRTLDNQRHQSHFNLISSHGKCTKARPSGI